MVDYPRAYASNNAKLILNKIIINDLAEIKHWIQHQKFINLHHILKENMWNNVPMLKVILLI